jgi:hypothetical protein
LLDPARCVFLGAHGGVVDALIQVRSSESRCAREVRQKPKPVRGGAANTASTEAATSSRGSTEQDQA